jgi:uncharacterized membrane protein YfcA
MEQLPDFFIFIAIGFAAQLIDGALGMAYGLISMTILLGMGISPAMSSATVHMAEIFTTGISGISHAMFKNIDYYLFKKLVIPGVFGSVIGALLLSWIPEEIIKPLIAMYLFVMGIFVFCKGIFKQKKWNDKDVSCERSHSQIKKDKNQPYKWTFLGFGGGLFDVLGGGGWGSIVSSTLLAQGEKPRCAIGSVNLAEFIIALSSSITFLFTIGIGNWLIVIGLLIGGGLAAPLAAFVVHLLPAKTLMYLVGGVVILLALRTLSIIFFD